MKFTKLAAAITLALAVSAAQADTADSTFNVKLTVTGTCDGAGFTANTTSDVDFGTKTAAANNPAYQATNSAATALKVACSKGTVATIGLTPSNASTTGAGVMVGTLPADQIAYQLTQPTAAYAPAYTTNWGNTGVGLFSVTGTGLATPIAVPVQATVAANILDVPAGAYTDAVTATLSY